MYLNFYADSICSVLCTCIYPCMINFQSLMFNGAAPWILQFIFCQKVYLLYYTSLFSSHGFCIHWLFGDDFLASWAVEIFYHIKKTKIDIFINIITCYC